MQYWLVKTEPGTWSWDDQVKAGSTHWDGVRNHQAANNMRAMKKGDRCFFYHSVSEKQVVGIVKVSRTFYPDPADDSGKFGMVDVTAVRPMKTPVTLAQIKAEPGLSEMVLVKNSRLSVQPVTAEEWTQVCAMGGVPKG
ncbi:EVE domain-containing protein [Marinibaculum pumilum]|uniref:EVE domain-containing protein n=1 Tax=Marinibaculum pumilum TaxID=1766165 RepID=A0ABV7KY28_9PROT